MEHINLPASYPDRQPRWQNQDQWLFRLTAANKLDDVLDETLHTPTQGHKPYFLIGHKTAAYILSIIDQ